MTDKQLDKLGLGPGESTVLKVYRVYLRFKDSDERYYMVVHDGSLSYIDTCYVSFELEKNDPACIREYTRLADARRMVTKFFKEFEPRKGTKDGLGIEEHTVRFTGSSTVYGGTNTPVFVDDEVLEKKDIEYRSLNC